MEKNIKVSICIPVYPMEKARYFLERCLDSVIAQTFEDFEVVVTDNSDDDELMKLCQTYAMPIKYSKSGRRGACANTNEAIKRARGEIIKILHMDDFFARKDSLSELVGAFKGGWLATGCTHTTNGKDRVNPHLASYNHDIHIGNNTIGSPSVLAFENSNPLLFDESSVWLFDCDYYKRLYNRYGHPTIVRAFNVVIGLGQHQMTNKIPDSIKKSEKIIMKKRYV